jgi:hypothetical protein
MPSISMSGLRALLVASAIGCMRKKLRNAEHVSSVQQHDLRFQASFRNLSDDRNNRTVTVRESKAAILVI